MDLPEASENDKDLLIKEYKQAWEQYRHLEDSRMKLVSLAVTFFLSALAFTGVLFRIEGKLGNEVYIVALLANATVFFLHS